MTSIQDLEQQAKHLLAQYQFGPAQKVLAKWLSEEPNNAEAHYLMAGAYGNVGEFRQAERHCRKSIDLRDDYFDALFRLANALDGQGKANEALGYFRQASELNPAAPHLWNNMGACYMSLKLYTDAENAYRKAVDLDSSVLQFQYNLVLALIPQSRESSEKLTEAVRLAEKVDEEEQGNMDLADQLYFDTTLGISFMTFQAPEVAEKYFRRNLEQETDSAESHLNLALVLVAQNKEQEALQSTKLAQQSWTEQQSSEMLAEIYWTMGLIYLGLGHYEKAWPLYEYRWKRESKATPNIPGVLWNGETLKNKTLYIIHEQGFGDNLQFSRYFSVLKQKGATIVYECQKPLHTLYSANENIDRLINSGQVPGKYDYYLPLASLPGVMKTTLNNIPSTDIAYLTVPAADYSSIDNLLSVASRKKRIGIFWRGSGSQANDKRPCDLKNWSPLLATENTFFSLQKEFVTEHDEALFEKYAVVDMRPVIYNFADTAYIISQLDLVITIDTSVAHLAGALNCPGYVLLSYAADWRWGRQVDEAPWYSSLKLIRQKSIGNWTQVVEDLLRTLA